MIPEKIEISQIVLCDYAPLVPLDRSIRFFTCRCIRRIVALNSFSESSSVALISAPPRSSSIPSMTRLAGTSLENSARILSMKTSLCRSRSAFASARASSCSGSGARRQTVECRNVLALVIGLRKLRFRSREFRELLVAFSIASPFHWQCSKSRRSNIS